MRIFSKFVALIALLLLLGVSYLLSIVEFEKDWEEEQPKKKRKQLNQIKENAELINSAALADESADYSIEVYSVSTGYGYKILRGKDILINQAHIPAVNGIVHFYSEEQAKKTASLAITKIRSGFFPPTISIHELDSLKIKY
jgi:hypothetical protein